MNEAVHSSVGASIAFKNRRLRPYAVTVFVTLHLLSVIIYVLPRPPDGYKRMLDNADAQDELGRISRFFHRIAPLGATEGETRDEMLKILDRYIYIHDKVRGLFEPYLKATSSTQSWNMFGGVPRHPVVLQVEVMPAGSRRYVPFKDFIWGTPDYEDVNFRHFKVQEFLALPGWERERAEYAVYWARRWDEEHADMRAKRVRLVFVQLNTPSPQSVRSGSPERRAHVVERSAWKVSRNE